jgi:hypothetical protein
MLGCLMSTKISPFGTTIVAARDVTFLGFVMLLQVFAGIS